MSGLSLDIDCPGSGTSALQLDCELPAQGSPLSMAPAAAAKRPAGLYRRPAATGTGSSIHSGAKTWQTGTVFTPTWQRRIGYVFQDARLFPHLSVQAEPGLRPARAPGQEQSTLAQVSDWLELQPICSRNAQQLSAGQKQRVAIARALLSAPRLLLAG